MKIVLLVKITIEILSLHQNKSIRRGCQWPIEPWFDLALFFISDISSQQSTR